MTTFAPTRSVSAANIRLCRLACDIDEAIDELEAWHLTDGEAALLGVPIVHLAISLRRLEQIVHEVEKARSAAPARTAKSGGVSMLSKIDFESLAANQLKNGSAFILDAPDEIPAIWGNGTDILWSAGESLFITGPQGVGKSTVAQQLMLARHGITDPTLLGFPVAPTDGIALYLACDRPRQIARSLRRMVNASHAELLQQRLRFWAGPLPFDIVRDPLKLTEFAQTFGASTLIIDSLKDIASPLSSDEVGSAVNRAIGSAIASGIEVVPIHHNRKAQVENRKPNTLADVYGSTWITSGAGSVISLWGEAGDPLVELSHLKQPADDIGPLDLEHDHQHGITRRRERADAWSLLQASSSGITANAAATEIYGAKATRAQLEKVRRRLVRYVDDGYATSSKGSQRTDQVVFRPSRANGRVEHRVGPRVATRDLHAATRAPENTGHGSYTAPDSSAPSLREGPNVYPKRVPDQQLPDGWTEDQIEDLIARTAP